MPSNTPDHLCGLILRLMPAVYRCQMTVSVSRQKKLPFVFERFYRVSHGNRQDVRGYGIGLYYVRQIVDKMGWGISVKSREGHGSVFTIKFKHDEDTDS